MWKSYLKEKDFKHWPLSCEEHKQIQTYGVALGGRTAVVTNADKDAGILLFRRRRDTAYNQICRSGSRQDDVALVALRKPAQTNCIHIFPKPKLKWKSVVVL